MKQQDMFFSLLKNNNGYLTAKTAGKNGVSASTLKRLAEHGLIDRAARGLYVSVDTMDMDTTVKGLGFGGIDKLGGW